jgi:predicted phage terminase large subunit-like protein
MKLLDFAKIARPTFKFDWFHSLLMDYLEALYARSPEVENLAISLPPGSGKTETCILFDAFAVAHNPLREHVISVSNADTLARLACTNVLRVLNRPDIQSRFPLRFDQETQNTFTVSGSDGRPAMWASGLFGTLTGMRSTLTVIDDPIKNLEVAYSTDQLDKIEENLSAVVETRSTPGSPIVVIATRWSHGDPTGRFIEKALTNPDARQWKYINLACWNRGEDSFIHDTKTDTRTFLPKYEALAKVKGQAYSFTKKQFEGKRADLGDLFSPLYLGQPIANGSALFPSEAWGVCDPNINHEELDMIVTAWDCASKTGAGNDYSANVVVGHRSDGFYVVLDAWKSKVDFSQLPGIIAERYKAIYKRYRNMALLAIEDTSAGQQAIQLIQATHPEVPLLAAKATKSKVIRAQGVTPLTRAGLVLLPRGAEWREQFISELAQFPAGRHDDVVDAFVHALKTFYAQGDFRPHEFQISPGRLLSESEAIRQTAREMIEDVVPEFEAISPELDDFDRRF